MLQSQGLPSMDAPSGLMEALAGRIHDHDHLRSLIARCDPKERVHMYDSLKPHIRKFRPYPLETYIMQSKQLAEAKQLPTWDGKNFSEYKPFTMRTLWRIDVAADSLDSNRIIQAMRYLQRDIPDEMRQSVAYKVHLIVVNGVDRVQISAGVYVYGSPQRVQ
jgi:hypothetical protein